MNLIYFLFSAFAFFVKDHSTNEFSTPCSCITYELKNQIQEQELIAHAIVLRIDTIPIVPSYYCDDPGWCKSLYEDNYTMKRIIFKNIKTLKGKLDGDTFSVISLNHCVFEFYDKNEYIVAAHSQKFSHLYKESDSIKFKSQTLLSTNNCSGNSFFYKGADTMYMRLLKF